MRDDARVAQLSRNRRERRAGSHLEFERARRQWKRLSIPDERDRTRGAKCEHGDNDKSAKQSHGSVHASG